MTPQAVFNKVVNGLRKQGRKSVSETEIVNGKPACMYRGDNKTRCAVGQLIRNSEYKPWMESSAFHFILSQDCPHICHKSLKVRLRPHADLIDALQKVHDNADVAEWEVEFKQTASRYDLVYTPPKTKQSKMKKKCKWGVQIGQPTKQNSMKWLENIGLWCLGGSTNGKSYDYTKPILFNTRREAREYAKRQRTENRFWNFHARKYNATTN